MKQARALFVGRTLWVLEMHRGVALEPRTGRVQRTVPASLCRCFPPVATPRYLFSGELDLTDLATGRIDACRITKAACGRDAGWVPGNGLIYLCPKHCVCWPMLRGYVALAPARPGATPRKKPAKEDFTPEVASAPAPSGPGATDGPWPCYRADAWRSGSTSQAVAVELETLWTARNERGQLQFKSTYFSVDRVDAGAQRACDTVYHPRAVQPALLYWQRTGDERLGKLFAAWMDTWVDAAARAERGKPAGILPSAAASERTGGTRETTARPASTAGPAR